MSSKLGVHGSIEVIRLYPNGCRAVMLRKPNLIYDNGLSALSRLLGGFGSPGTVGGVGYGTLSDIAVRTMQFGTNPSPTVPVNAGTTGVETLLYQSDVAVTYPTASSVQFQASIPLEEGNGTTITEECLIMGNGVVFARVLLNEPKTDAYALLIAHTFNFARL